YLAFKELHVSLKVFIVQMYYSSSSSCSSLTLC
ncbi:serine incorporator 1, isoform CRA_b, partial [Mus musculus]